MFDPNDFVECSVIAINKDYPRQFMAMYVNTFYDVAGNPGWSVGNVVWPTETWVTLDLSSYIHPDAKAVLLNNLLIVTSNISQQTANMTLEFRRWGAGSRTIKGDAAYLNPVDRPTSTDLADAMHQYHGQAVAISNGDLNISPDIRNPDSCWVAVNQGKIQVFYRITGPHNPTHAYYGLNVTVGGYAR